MENYVIYDTDEIKVEIDGLFHEFIESMVVKSFKLSKTQCNILIEYVLKRLKQNNYDIRDVSIKLSSRVIVIENEKYIELVEPFDILAIGYDTLVSEENPRENKKELSEEISQYYKYLNTTFYMEIFDEPTYKTDGVMAAIVNKNLLITFFAFKQ